MKNHQADTATRHLHEPQTTRMDRSHEQGYFALLQGGAPGGSTLKEPTHRLNEVTGYVVPDSSPCQLLNLLRLKRKGADTGQERRCGINGIMKNVWTAVAVAENGNTGTGRILTDISSNEREDIE